MEKQPLWTRDFICICLCNLFVFITYYTLVTTLPLFVLDVLQGRERETGLVVTSLILAAVLFRPISGKWVDERGKKNVLLISAALYFTSSTMYLGMQSLLWLLALRFLHGISFSLVTTAMGAIAADVVPDRRKGEGIGYFATFMNLAMVIGPFLGLTIISRFDFTILFIVLSAFSFLAFLFGCIVRVPASVSVSEEAPSEEKKKLIETDAIPISLAGLLMAFAYSGIITFVPVYTKEMGIAESGSTFFVAYALMIMLARPFTGRMFDRLGPHVVIYPCIVLYVIGLIVLSRMQSPALLLATAAIIGVGYGTLFPSFQAIAVKSSSTQRRGAATGTYLLFFDIGFGLGAFVLGWIAALWSYKTMYLLSSAVVALGLIVYFGLVQQRERKRKPGENIVEIHGGDV